MPINKFTPTPLRGHPFYDLFSDLENLFLTNARGMRIYGFDCMFKIFFFNRR